MTDLDIIHLFNSNGFKVYIEYKEYSSTLRVYIDDRLKYIREVCREELIFDGKLKSSLTDDIINLKSYIRDEKLQQLLK